MSDAADDVSWYEPMPERDYTSYIWETKEGKYIPIWELEDSHILNILRIFPHAANVKTWYNFKKTNTTP